MSKEFTYYESQENADRTEGRGPMRAIGHFADIAQAVHFVKGRGVMGVGDGEVVKVHVVFLDDGKVKEVRKKVYGYHRNPRTGGYNYGYLDPNDDPGITIEIKDEPDVFGIYCEGLTDDRGYYAREAEVSGLRAVYEAGLKAGQENN